MHNRYVGLLPVADSHNTAGCSGGTPFDDGNVIMTVHAVAEYSCVFIVRAIVADFVGGDPGRPAGRFHQG